MEGLSKCNFIIYGKGDNNGEADALGRRQVGVVGCLQRVIDRDVALLRPTNIEEVMSGKGKKERRIEGD